MYFRKFSYGFFSYLEATENYNFCAKGVLIFKTFILRKERLNIRKKNFIAFLKSSRSVT